MFRENNKFKLIIDSMPDGFAYHEMILDGAGKAVDYIFLEVNRAFEEQTGWKKEDIAGKKASEVLPGICRFCSSWVDIFGKVALTGRSIKFEHCFDVSQRWYEITAFSDEYGYFSTVFHDITDHKQAENTLQYQLEFEKTISAVSANFIRLPPHRIDEGIEYALKAIGEMCQADRSYLFLFNQDEVLLDNKHEWCAEGIESQKDNLQGITAESVPWWMERLKRSENIVIEDVAEMPPEALVEKEMLEAQSIRSVVVVPLSYLRRLIGFIGFDYVRRPSENFKHQVALLEIMSQIISSAIQRQWAQAELHESEEKYRLLFENAPLGILGFDQEGVINACNDYLVKITGSSREALIGLNLLSLPDRKFGEAVQGALRGTPMVYDDQYRFTTSPGTALLRTWIAPLTSADGKIVGGMGIVEDVTERKQSEKEKEEANLLLEEIIELLPDATFVIDVQGKVIFWNKAMEEMTGVYKDQIIGRGNHEYAIPFYGERRPILIDLVLLPESQYAILKDMYEFINRGVNTLLGEMYAPKAYCGKGAYLWGAASRLGDGSGRVVGAIESIRDITDRKNQEERLTYISLYDHLTGLYNRAFFEEEMRRFNKSREYPITIISADLNGLKLINDTMGHGLGDKLLETCARILRKSLRSSDILARLGGDEFVAILPRTSEKTGEDIAGRLRSNIALYNQQHPELPLSISIGLATAKEEGESLEETLRKSDFLMYRDKLNNNASTRGHIINTLLGALAERDYIAGGHAQRLSELCLAMGEKLGFTIRQITNLVLLAQVHDLGKLGVPDMILYKKGPLTEEEWEIMRLHPEKGYRIALSAPDLPDVAELILKHHERWDGKGYPLGLKGSEIPIECRVLAIVDAFDAMTNNRPYREAKSCKEAIKRIEEGAGTQFDPELVKVFLSVVR